MALVIDLTGKVAMVTGASRGIGKAIALGLAEAGADIVASARTLKDIEETAREVRELGRRALAVPVDVTKAEQVDNGVKRALEAFGQIDILVNNAGTFLLKPIVPLPNYKPYAARYLPNFHTPVSEEEWQRMIDTNLTSAFLFCRAVGPHMLERRQGKVINITSMEAAKAFTTHTSYNATKAGLWMLTRSLALEWARHNVQVNAIGPGYYYTTLNAVLFDDERVLKQTLSIVPQRRLGDLKDLGKLAAYLASDAADFITGQCFFIDGGITA